MWIPPGGGGGGWDAKQAFLHDLLEADSKREEALIIQRHKLTL